MTNFYICSKRINDWQNIVPWAVVPGLRLRSATKGPWAKSKGVEGSATTKQQNETSQPSQPSKPLVTWNSRSEDFTM